MLWVRNLFVGLLLLAALAAPASAVSETNGWRVYGQVNRLFVANNFRALFVAAPDGAIVRVDCRDASGAGCDGIVLYQWVVMEGAMQGVVGCLDEPNVELAPSAVWRWTGSYWELFDPATRVWVPWL